MTPTPPSDPAVALSGPAEDRPGASHHGLAPPLCFGAERTAEQVRAALAHDDRTGWDLLCVVDAQRRLLGTLRPQELIALHGARRLGDVVRHAEQPVAAPDASEEQLATLAIRHGLTAIPVVDAQRRVIGVVGPAALMDVLRREHVEDLHRLAGITVENARARDAVEEPPLRRARHRLPWLVVGLLGGAVATGVVSHFEQALAERPAIAFFVPALVYLADAIGTQSEAVAVRGVSLSRMSWSALVGSELRTGVLMGTVLALLAWVLVWLTWRDAPLAAAVALALAGASTVATGLGTLLPLVLARAGVDPAYGSGPLATILQDVLTLVIYFACVSWLVL